MSTYSQNPGVLNLSFRSGDEVSTSIDFSIALTGYTVSSSIISLVTSEVIASPTTTVTNAAGGVVSVALNESQTTASPPGTYAWKLWWDAPGAVRRTALTGFVEVSK